MHTDVKLNDVATKPVLDPTDADVATDSQTGIDGGQIENEELQALQQILAGSDDDTDDNDGLGDGSPDAEEDPNDLP